MAGRAETETRAGGDAARAMAAREQLVAVVQALSLARDNDAIVEIVRHAARELTGADGATFVLRDGDQCHYVGEDAIGPLWTGRKFPLEACISGWAMLNARAAIIPDIYQDSRIPQDAYRPTFVRSLAMVPIRREAPIGAIGNYWADHHVPTEEEVGLLQALADTTSVALENVRLLTDLKASIKELESRAERIRQQRDTLEIFSRALAHDLKEPARAIAAFSEIILEEAHLEGETLGHFGHIRNAGTRMLALVDAVMQYMVLDRPAQTPREDCALGPLVEAAVDNLAALVRDTDARVEISPLPPVHTHPTLAMQLVQNLLANAMTHCDKKPHIKVSAATHPTGWEIAITDNGPGIEERQHDRIFQPFQRGTARGKGSGLGLAICSRIAANLGGAVRLESAPGNGATFYFTLPAAKATLTAPSTGPTEARTQTGQGLARLLLVDDLPADLELIQIMLRRAGLACDGPHLARGGQEALEMMHQGRRSSRPIDVVLLDINMPGMDGFETLERIRADLALAGTTVLICSGSTHDSDRQRSRALGADGYLLKPVDKNSLTGLLAGLPGLELSQADGSLALRKKA